jgi:GMP synthase-like glutamine amidotransferase
MKPALLVTHLPDRDPGLIRECLEAEGCPVHECNALDGSRLPAVADVSAIVSLGGRMSATELAQHPFLISEVSLIEATLERGLPVLGMCLGAQLLAVAAGGEVSRIGAVYAGWPELSITHEGRVDPVFGQLTDRLPVLEWHEDQIEVPETAAILGTTQTPGAALFRIGSAAWGSQMHLEVTSSLLIDCWLDEEIGVVELEGAGHKIDEFRAESSANLPAQMSQARSAFVSFAKLLDAR